MDSPVAVLGTRFRNTLNQLPSLTYTAGAVSSLKLPKTFLHRALTLRFRGTATIATATAVAIGDGILNVIKKIEIVGDGRKVYQAVDGASAYKLSSIMMGKTAECFPPILTAGARPFAFAFQLHHEAAGMRQPNDSFFDPRRHEEVELRITWAGADTEVITPGGGGTAVISGTLDLILEQTTTGAESVIVNRLLNFREDSISATSTNFSYEVPRNGILAGMLFKCTRAGVPVNDIINKISLRSDSSFLHADNLRWDTLQEKNVIEYGLDRPLSLFSGTGYSTTYDPSQIGAAIDGYAFLPMIEDGMLSSGLNTLALNTLEVVLDVTRTSGTELIRNTMLFFEPRDLA